MKQRKVKCILCQLKTLAPIKCDDTFPSPLIKH